MPLQNMHASKLEAVDTETLNPLQSDEQLKLLNEIDKLRSHGVNVLVPPLQLVVCGDQSSGKSSVLEAITGIPFPRRDNLCTRFAIKIILHRTAFAIACVRIIPGSHRSAEDREKLESFTRVVSDFSDVPHLVEDANTVMGLYNSEGTVSSDTLSINIYGPDKPQLTIVDLPGLIRAENCVQSKADAQLVLELVNAYMIDRRTIILAVVSAENDYASQIGLKRAKEADIEGMRTLGIITKPDTLPAGSESEKNFVTLAQNRDIYLRLGWHVLRNRNYQERDCSVEERNTNEHRFFESEVWKEFDTGIDVLRTRLSTLLLNRLKRELPKVHQEIFNNLSECEREIGLLGQRRSTPEEQRMLLFRVSELFSSRCVSAVDGTYENPFFSLTDDSESKCRRLRAQIQAINSDFRQKMQLKGHWRTIVNDDNPPANGPPNLPETITHKQAIEWVIRHRGLVVFFRVTQNIRILMILF